MTLLAAEALQIGYNGRAALPPIDFRVEAGQMWALIGRNGSGKTTLLRTLLGLLPRVGGRLDRGGTRIGYVPQRLEMDLSVPMRSIDLVRGGQDTGYDFLNPLAPFRARAALQRALEDTGAAAFAGRQFATLSEGQKQRVLLARAISMDPALLVLDEPTSAMDAAAEATAFELISTLMTRRNLGVIVVAHHLAVLARRATHLVYLDADCKLVLSGPSEIVAHDPTFVAHYGDLFHGMAIA
jgi:ABC-type Mn2+/Zn2+ transport system ATPase subunit